MANSALFSNTTGSNNAAVGAFALYSNTAGGNTAIGNHALYSNTVGDLNTAIGDSALYSNTTSVTATGHYNTAIGNNALYSNTIGSSNTAIGVSALVSNTATVSGAGEHNTAVGFEALFKNTTGNHNTAIGSSAGLGVDTASNVICIGADVGGADISNTTWIGNVYGVAALKAQTAPVIMSEFGQLGTVVSSERFKKDIATMDQASEAVLSLRPVSFHYKTGRQRHTAIWVDCRRSRQGESGPGRCPIRKENRTRCATTR